MESRMPKKEVTVMQPYLFLAPKTVPYYFEIIFSTFLLKCLCLNSGTEKIMILQTNHTFFHLSLSLFYLSYLFDKKSFSGLSSRINIYFSGQLFFISMLVLSPSAQSRCTTPLKLGQLLVQTWILNL